jgi:hypothetical protein
MMLSKNKRESRERQSRTLKADHLNQANPSGVQP